MHYRARSYDPRTGRFIQFEPRIAARVHEHYRYVSERPVDQTDPSGLGIGAWKRIARILAYKWSTETANRAAKRLASELLDRLKAMHPNDPEAKRVLQEPVDEGWTKGPLGQGSKAGIPLEEGGGLILREPGGSKFLQWHPGGGHHGPDPYWKFSSTESGILRINRKGILTVLVSGVIPATAEAVENPKLTTPQTGVAGLSDAADLLLPVGPSDFKEGGEEYGPSILRGARLIVDLLLRRPIRHGGTSVLPR